MSFEIRVAEYKLVDSLSPTATMYNPGLVAFATILGISVSSAVYRLIDAKLGTNSYSAFAVTEDIFSFDSKKGVFDEVGIEHTTAFLFKKSGISSSITASDFADTLLTRGVPVTDLLDVSDLVLATLGRSILETIELFELPNKLIGKSAAGETVEINGKDYFKVELYKPFQEDLNIEELPIVSKAKVSEEILDIVSLAQRVLYKYRQDYVNTNEYSFKSFFKDLEDIPSFTSLAIAARSIIQEDILNLAHTEYRDVIKRINSSAKTSIDIYKDIYTVLQNNIAISQIILTPKSRIIENTLELEEALYKYISKDRRDERILSTTTRYLKADKYSSSAARTDEDVITAKAKLLESIADFSEEHYKFITKPGLQSRIQFGDTQYFTKFHNAGPELVHLNAELDYIAKAVIALSELSTSEIHSIVFKQTREETVRAATRAYKYVNKGALFDSTEFSSLAIAAKARIASSNATTYSNIDNKNVYKGILKRVNFISNRLMEIEKNGTNDSINVLSIAIAARSYMPSSSLSFDGLDRFEQDVRKGIFSAINVQSIFSRTAEYYRDFTQESIGFADGGFLLNQDYSPGYFAENYVGTEIIF
jgi:hypothetical protein